MKVVLVHASNIFAAVTTSLTMVVPSGDTVDLVRHEPAKNTQSNMPLQIDALPQKREDEDKISLEPVGTRNRKERRRAAALARRKK